jgi:uncharacterized protein (TIGR03000 family)
MARPPGFYGAPVPPAFRGGYPAPLYRGVAGPYYRSYSPAFYGGFYGGLPPYGSSFSLGYARPGVAFSVNLGGPLYAPAYRPWSYGGYATGLSNWYFPTTVRYPVVYSAPAVGAIVGSAVPVVPYTSALPGDAPPATTAAPTQAAAPAPAATSPVYVDVKAPDGAQVWLGSTQSNQSGAVRSFVSPPLNPGSEYVYVVKASWVENGQPVTREKRVTVRAGEKITVDMTAEK